MVIKATKPAINVNKNDINSELEKGKTKKVQILVTSPDNQYMPEIKKYICVVILIMIKATG